MYYWTPTIQTPVEQHMYLDDMQPPNVSSSVVSHVSAVDFFYLYKLTLDFDISNIYNVDSLDLGRVPVWTCLISEIIYYAGYTQLESKYLTIHM